MRGVWRAVIGFCLVLSVLTWVSPPPASAGRHLFYRGVDISRASPFGCQQIGFTLPLSNNGYGSALFDYSFPYPEPFPEGVPANLFLVFNDFSYWSAGGTDALRGPSGQRASTKGPCGDGGQKGLDLMDTIQQFVWVYPIQPHNPHIRFFTYLIAPILGVESVTVTKNRNPATGRTGNGLSATSGGLFDIFWEPLGINWAFSTGEWQKWVTWSLATEFFIEFPAGPRNPDNLVSTGSNTFGILPLTLSWWQPGTNFGFFHRLTNENVITWLKQFNNRDFPAPGFVRAINRAGPAPGARTTFSPGSTFIWDSDFWFKVYGAARAGFTVNWLQGTEPEEIAGSPIVNSEAQEVSVGPSFFYTASTWNLLLKIPFNVQTVNAYDTWEVWFAFEYTFGMPDLPSYTLPWF